MIFSMFEQFKQTFNMLYNILSNFWTFGRSKIRHRVRFVKNINSYYTEFLFMMAAKRSNKKWQDGKKEKLIDFYEENLCLWNIFDNSYQKRDVKEHWLVSLTNWMFKWQISNQNEIQYEDSLEQNWIKWNLVKAGRVLTICMWANGCFGTSFSSDNLWWRQQKAEMHFRLAMIVFK